jgi:hypothetical protein
MAEFMIINEDDKKATQAKIVGVLARVEEKWMK